MASGHKVYISGISPDLAKDDLISMLLKFGDMVTMFLSDGNVSGGQKSGYVVYQTKLECYRAISELHEQPPFYLRMQYGDPVKKESSRGRNHEVSSLRHSPALIQRSQAQFSNIQSRRLIRRTSVQLEQVVVNEVVENQDLNSYALEEKNLRSRKYRSKLSKRGVDAPKLSVTDGVPGIEKRTSNYESGLQASQGGKKNYDGQSKETSDKCLHCGQQGDESCGRCGVTYCSKTCQRNDWNRHKHQCGVVGEMSSPGAENLVPEKSSSSKIERSPQEKIKPPKRQTSIRQVEENVGSENSLTCPGRRASFEKGNKISPKPKENTSVEISCDKKGMSCTPRGTKGKRISDEVDHLTENQEEKIKAVQSKNGVIKSQDFNKLRCDEISKIACNEGELTQATNDVDGIGKGNILDPEILVLSSTWKSENHCEHSIHHESRKPSNYPISLPEKEINQQVCQEPERTKPHSPVKTSPLSVKLERLIFLKNQEKEKNEAITDHSVEHTLNLSDSLNKSEKTHATKVMASKVSPLPNSKRNLDIDSSQETKSVNKDLKKSESDTQADVTKDEIIQSSAIDTSPKIPSLFEVTKHLDVDAILRQISENEEMKKNEKMQPRDLDKVSKIPAVDEKSSTTGVTQQIQNANDSRSNLKKWDLFSDDPKTQIINYDLCTLQKKLPTEAFIKVKICSILKSGEYWVQPVDKEEVFAIQNLLRNKKTSQTPFESKVGEYCRILHNDSWYRALIISKEEKAVKLFLIDFGRSIASEAEQLKELPHLAKNFYAQAMHIQVDHRTPAQLLNCKEGDILTVKASGKIQEGVIKVQLKDVLYAHEVPVPKQLSLASLTDECKEGETPSSDKRTQWPQSVLCLLKEGDEVSCSVLNVTLSEDEYKDEAVLAIGFESIADDVESIAVDFPNDCKEKPEDFGFNPSVGDLVAAFSNGLDCWVRSIVLDAGCRRWLVACFDIGLVEEVTEIREIPEDKKYRKTLALSAECLITKSLFPRDSLFCEGRLEQGATLCAKVLKKKDETLECQMGRGGDRTFCFATMRAWSPKPNCSAHATLHDQTVLPGPVLDQVEVTPGWPVKIVSFFESLVMYVQPCDAESKSEIKELHESIADIAVKNGAIKEDPIKGKKYICRYSGDMKYYRVIVKRVKSPTEIFVLYIDYGNEETVKKEQLFELPPEFEMVPCYGVRIELKKDFDNTLNNEARRYLSYLIMENKLLTLNYHDGNLRNAELWIYSNSLSDILKRLIDPTING